MDGGRSALDRHDMSKNPPERLSEPDYWSGVHAGAGGGRPAWKRILRRCLPAHWLEARKRWWEQREWAREQQGLREHWLFQLTEVLLRPRVQDKADLKGLEIGSAPGRISLELWRRLGLVPYGLEYTEAGVRAQQALYRKFGLPGEWVMPGDLFDDAWRARHAESFDVVASFGFIEHFGDPRDVVAKHLELLRPGGLLVVTVPNLNESTVYGRLVRRFNPAVYALHNTATCTRESLGKLAASLDCGIIHCDTLGGPDVQFVPDSRWSSRLVFRFFHLLNPMANRLNQVCLGKRLKPFPRTASTLALVAVKTPKSR
jgi:2-polyprenyl-3-methyl-5-hydroxy-6-metoxy-1,4-benzoquinol methylase